MQVDLLCAFRRVSQRVSRRLAHSQAHSINVGNIPERGKVFIRLQYPFCFVMPCHATLSSAMLEQWRCLTDTCARLPTSLSGDCQRDVGETLASN